MITVAPKAGKGLRILTATTAPLVNDFIVTVNTWPEVNQSLQICDLDKLPILFQKENVSGAAAVTLMALHEEENVARIQIRRSHGECIRQRFFSLAKLIFSEYGLLQGGRKASGLCFDKNGIKHFWRPWLLCKSNTTGSED